MGSLPLDAGQLNNRLVLEQPQTEDDGQGGVAPGWVAVAELWAKMEPVSPSYETMAGGERAAVTHRITLRHRADLRVGHRLRKGERVFTIRALRDPDESGRFCLLDCEEVMA